MAVLVETTNYTFCPEIPDIILRRQIKSVRATDLVLKKNISTISLLLAYLFLPCQLFRYLVGMYVCYVLRNEVSIGLDRFRRPS